jgi:hypothetical protein
MFIAIGKLCYKPNCEALYFLIVEKFILPLEEELEYQKIVAKLDEVWGFMLREGNNCYKERY